MKRLILGFAISLSCFHYTYGQVKLHGQIGMTFSTFDRDLMDEFGFIDYRQSLIDQGVNASTSARNSIRPGAVISIELDIYIKEDSFLKTGVKYTNAGDSYFFKTPDVQIPRLYGLLRSDARYKIRPRLDYIAIPLNYGKALNDFTVYGGITTHINFASALRSNEFEPSGGNTVQEVWDREDDFIDATKTVFSLNVGANYYIPAFDVDNVVSINISYSVNPVYDQAGSTGQINSARIWSIEVGYGATLTFGE